MQKGIRFNETQLQYLAAKSRRENTISGYLHKRSSDTGKWQLRYFVLYQNLLFHFESESAQKLSGATLLEGSYCERVLNPAALKAVKDTEKQVWTESIDNNFMSCVLFVGLHNLTELYLASRCAVFFFNSEVVYLINEVKTVTVNTHRQETKHLFIKIERSMHVFIITQLEQNHSYIHCFSKDLFVAMAFFPVAIVICKLIYKNSRNRCCSTTYTLNHLKQLKLRL